MPNLAALRAAIFCHLRKTDGGGAHMCPPAVRGLIVIRLAYSLWVVLYFAFTHRALAVLMQANLQGVRKKLILRFSSIKSEINIPCQKLRYRCNPNRMAKRTIHELSDQTASSPHGDPLCHLLGVEWLGQHFVRQAGASGVPTYRAFRACPVPLDSGRPCRAANRRKKRDQRHLWSRINDL